jgi:uncharacterized coiled-coil protein SlyX
VTLCSSCDRDSLKSKVHESLSAPRDRLSGVANPEVVRLVRRVDEQDETVRAIGDTLLDIKETVDQHTETLAAIQETLAQQGGTLAQQGETLEHHSELLTRQGETLEHHSELLAEILRRLSNNTAD